ncbi:hypothetical protein ACH5RR_007637 [Cinchona calisaya]|uniref:Ent-kaurenoic acid oxidase n=1 Tax=Cinchona calisaya TaxID=153742 RepID=A0ABD3ACX7_9GENT
MEVTIDVYMAILVGIVSLLGSLFWWWNDIFYALPLSFRCSASGTKLPPGSMGLPFLGEMLHFLYYFKLVRRPDDYINAKRKKYGDKVGLYRTHLFGKPSIIVCSPSACKFVLQSEENFFLEWPAVEIVGKNSLVAVEGRSHTRVRNLVVKVINQPDALRRIAETVQPRIIAALKLWAHKGRIIAYNEAKKVTFENIGKYFAGIEPGTHLETLDKLFEGMVKGIRSQPINFPGTTYHHALQCRKKALAIFKKEMDKRKNGWDESKAKNDLMDGLMRLKDEEGKQLSEMEVLDNIVSLVVAGYESTSISIMWAVYYIAKYPNVLKRLQEEHKSIAKNGDLITSDDIQKLKYTVKVVEEAIRLANIAQVFFRTARKDADYKGYRIPEGWKLICWARYMHTNPENFEDPLCFNPDRWDGQPKPGTYLVFGGGSRICAGNMLARLQVAIFIHHLVVGYRWELVNPEAKMTYLPHPKPVDLVEINISRI